jgi:hypothetical protein
VFGAAGGRGASAVAYLCSRYRRHAPSKPAARGHEAAAPVRRQHFYPLYQENILSAPNSITYRLSAGLIETGGGRGWKNLQRLRQSDANNESKYIVLFSVPPCLRLSVAFKPLRQFSCRYREAKPRAYRSPLLSCDKQQIYPRLLGLCLSLTRTDEVGFSKN